MRESRWFSVLWSVAGEKSGKHKAKFSKIPKIITNQGEEWEELMRERGNRWISAVSRGDTVKKNILESERYCDHHFVSGKPAATWDKYNIDWVPTLNLGKMKFKGDEQREQNRRLQKKGLKERKNEGNAPLNGRNSKLPRREKISM